MRVFKPMLRWLPAGIFALIFLLATVLPAAAADTGTYQITNYMVTMEPQSSGQVRMTYEQDWKVLGGHIPWIVVDMANSDFTIESYGDAAAKASTVNSEGFNGVRVDLDKDYLPGQTFKVQFVVLQSNLLERLTSEKKWRIDFTPDWYDNAVIDHLQINLTAPVNTQAYSLLNPQPTINGNTLTWDKYNIPKGGRFNIQVECLDGNFLSATAPISSGNQGTNTWVIVGVIAGILIVIYLLIVVAVRQNRKARDADIKSRIAATEKELAEDREKEKAAEKGFEEYVEKKGIQPDQQGRYYDQGYGGYITPIIWMAVLSNQSRQAPNPAPHTPLPCACACVSCACACACACAGGGAAGCSRKTLHDCRGCEKHPQF